MKLEILNPLNPCAIEFFRFNCIKWLQFADASETEHHHPRNTPLENLQSHLKLLLVFLDGKSSSALPSSSPSFSSKLKSPLKQLGCLQSFLPLHSAVATARLTSCLNDGSRSCRALSQELGLSVPR
uniref:Uncharacterized protein LOC104237213 isoform X2 n=1 Tax=Nicotiana sylvestris TaxID=4096 RepID=A0A1U7XJ10_NICSY|nr:PREDICTED: uncharacterized protein LOC104237213 isoform X2 [Nicotiana sylvestris]